MLHRICFVHRFAFSLVLAAALVSFACKDEDPCDPGQVERNALCYPADTAGGSGGSAGSASSSAGAAGEPAAGGAPASVEAEFGQPCADTAAHSDCGGQAPICAPLPSGSVCTQIECQDGEANAGACPAEWSCLKVGDNPSACVNF
jgi:hypothetical protein